MTSGWSISNHTEPLYQAKFINCPDIIDNWLSTHGGLAGKDILEFGCGEGTMALGMALRKGPRRVVGVEILDVYQQCLPIACQQIGLQSLPTNLQLSRIIPGQGLETVGQFDFAYSWSVFEHVSQDMLRTALSSIKAVLRPGGLFFLQISPLYYSSNGSHMGPWVPEPWAHVILQQDLFHRALLAAAPTSPTVRGEWSVYIPLKADTATERASLWDTYVTLNKVTAPELCRMSRDAGFEIIRDYRTNSEAAIPPHLTEIYDEEALKTEQIVLLMRNPD